MILNRRKNNHAILNRRTCTDGLHCGEEDEKESPNNHKDLTDKQKMFCDEYLKTFNATKSAILAGYSKKTAGPGAGQVLRNIKVQCYLQKKAEEIFDRAKLSQDEVFAEVSRLAGSNMADFTNWGPGGVDIKDSSKLTREQTACVSEVSQTVTKDGGSVKFKLHSKEKALELLGKYYKLFTDRTEVTGASGGPITFKVVYDA